MRIEQRLNVFSIILIAAMLTIILVSCDKDECELQTFYLDADSDGLGNPEVSIEACEMPEGYVCNNNDTDDSNTGSEDDNGLHPAFEKFDGNNFTIFMDGDEIVIETNGHPNHTSPYWSNTTARSAIDPMGNTLTTPAASEDHPLFVEPTVTSHMFMAPGNIDDFNGDFTLRVPVSPEKATSSSATGLGPIGIAISGSVIYNDQEGPNVPLDNAVIFRLYRGTYRTSELSLSFRAKSVV